MAAWPGLWHLVLATILIQVIFSIFSIAYLWIKRRTASRGDAEAARVVILPVFEPLLWVCLTCQIIHFSLSIYTFPHMPSWKKRARWEEVSVLWTETLQYWLVMLSVNIEYNIIAALYMQTDLSHGSIRRSVEYVLLYALVTSLVSSYCYHMELSYAMFAFFDGLFFFFESAWYTGLLARSMIISRSTFLVYALYSLLWRLLIIPSSAGQRNNFPELYFLWVAFRSLAFSPCLYWTLWNETQYWRGNGTKSLWLLNREIGIIEDKERNGLQEAVIHQDLPELLKENKLIDFAFLRFDQVLDSGSHSKVYKGQLRGRTVAIKLFTPPEMDRNSMRRFIEETRIASKLEHPHIVKFHGVAVRPPDICMVVEYCELGSLFKVLSTESLDIQTKLSFMIQAASALSYLHSCSPPIIHRDIKSHNFLVTGSRMLKLADFGESRFIADDAKSQMTGYIGSHAYMSPEIITSAPYNTKADMYSLGIVLWEILTQRRPYVGIKQMSVLRMVVKLNLRPPLTSDVDPELGALLKETWSANPESRPSARNIIKRLLKFRKSIERGTKDQHRFSFQQSSSNPSVCTLPAMNSSSNASGNPKFRASASLRLSTSYPIGGKGRPDGGSKLDRGEAEGKEGAHSPLELKDYMTLSYQNSRKSRDRQPEDVKAKVNDGAIAEGMGSMERFDGGQGRPQGAGRKSSKKRWLLQNLLNKELSEVERQLNELAIRKMMLAEQLQLQRHQQLHAQPLTRSMSIGGYGSLRPKSTNASPRQRSQLSHSNSLLVSRISSISRDSPVPASRRRSRGDRIRPEINPHLPNFSSQLQSTSADPPGAQLPPSGVNKPHGSKTSRSFTETQVDVANGKAGKHDVQRLRAAEKSGLEMKERECNRETVESEREREEFSKEKLENRSILPSNIDAPAAAANADVHTPLLR